MISGGARGWGIGSFERMHFTSYGVASSFFLNPRSLYPQCSVADNFPQESLTSAVPWHLVQSGSDSTYVLRKKYLSLKNEGGVQEWSPLRITVNRDLTVSRRWPDSYIAEAGGASAEIVGAQEEQIRTLGGSEDKAVEADRLSSDEVLRGFKLDLVEGSQDKAMQAEIVEVNATSLDHKPSRPLFAPIEGAEAVRFVVIGALLLFVFWLGNYYVPDLIFKNTVFRKEPDDPLGPTDTTSGNKNLFVSSEEPKTGSKEASDPSEGDGSSAVKSGAGFNRIKKQKRRKSAKRR